jgi:hypothetical protein
MGHMSMTALPRCWVEGGCVLAASEAVFSGSASGESDDNPNEVRAPIRSPRDLFPPSLYGGESPISAACPGKALGPAD